MKYYKQILLPLLFSASLPLFASTANIDSLLDAIDKDNIENAKHLLAAGVEINQFKKSYKLELQKSPLMLAVEKGNYQMVSLLLDAGANVTLARKDGLTPLMMAAKSGHLDIAKQLISNGANVDREHPNGFAAYDYALQFNQIETMLYLIEYWAQQLNKNQKIWLLYALNKAEIPSILNLPNKEVQSLALVAAILRKDLVRLEQLLAKGFNPNTHNRSGYAALPMAVRLNRLAMMKVLLINNAFPTIGNDGDDEAIPMNQAARGNSIEAAQMLIEHQASVNKPNARGYTPLMLATMTSLDMVEYILAQNADTELKNIHGNTALIFAIYFNNFEMVKALVEAGADVNNKNHDGVSPIMYATSSPEIFSYLVAKGADIGAKSKREHTVMDYILQEQSQLPIAQLMMNKVEATEKEQPLLSILNSLLLEGVENQSKVDVQNILSVNADFYGYSLLSYACHFGSLDLVEQLLAEGVDVNKRSATGYHITPLMHAAINNQVDIGRLLIAHGANVKAQDRYGDAVINWATTYGHKEFVLMLLEQGADPTVASDEGWTALKTAQEQGRDELVKIFNQHLNLGR